MTKDEIASRPWAARLERLFTEQVFAALNDIVDVSWELDDNKQ